MVYIQCLKVIELNDVFMEEQVWYVYKISDSKWQIYSDYYESLHELKNELDENKLLLFLRESHPYFYKRIQEEQEFTFNHKLIKLNNC